MLSYFYLGFDPYYLLITAPFLLLSMWAAAKVKGTFARYNQQPLRSGYTGADAARAILRGAGIHDVRIEAVSGMLSDHYDPTQRVVRLSQDVLRGNTPAAVAVAAHECGHVLQHAANYAPMQWRSSMVPVVQFGSSLAIPMIFAGAFFHLFGLALLGVIAFSLAVLFHLVTLPVEFDASRRAIAIVERSGIATSEEMVGVRKTLYAAGFTYVAAALVAVVQLLYFLWRLGLLGGSSRD